MLEHLSFSNKEDLKGRKLSQEFFKHFIQIFPDELAGLAALLQIKVLEDKPFNFSDWITSNQSADFRLIQKPPTSIIPEVGAKEYTKGQYSHPLVCHVVIGNKYIIRSYYFFNYSTSESRDFNFELYTKDKWPVIYR